MVSTLLRSGAFKRSYRILLVSNQSGTIAVSTVAMPLQVSTRICPIALKKTVVNLDGVNKLTESKNSQESDGFISL